MRRLLAVLLIALPVRALAAQQTQSDALQRVLVAEDARGQGPDGIAPITAAWRSPDTLLRRVAARAAGRLQRADLAAPLAALLHDPVPAVRRATANALAQAVVRHDTSPPVSTVTMVADSLEAALATETDGSVIAVDADALGRLPYVDSATAQRAARVVLARAPVPLAFGVARGLYWLALNRRATGGLSPAAVSALRQAVVTDPDAEARRMAVYALGTGAALDSATTRIALADADPQVRRLALAGMRSMDAAARLTVVARMSLDTSALVRIAVIMSQRVGTRAVTCGPDLSATRDRVMYVRLAAIDALAGACDDPAGQRSELIDILGRPRSGPAAHAWQEPAHALVALAHCDTAAARQFLAVFGRAGRWQERMYAARAAAVVGDRATLTTLAADRDHNVVEAAVDGLRAMVGHAADSLYILALRSTGHQAVRAAAIALRGSADPDARAALYAALDRLSAERSENTRDPRVAILETLDSIGRPADSGRLIGYLSDFDSAVAVHAAATLSRWTGRTMVPHVVPLPIAPEPLATIFLAHTIRVRVALADSTGGGAFDVVLFADEAPATTARIVRLIRSHFYDGHVFHRVEPDFVVQGGGTDASEYAGDAAFMRDELTIRSHARGTLGISTRGRDTGDAQWFINLVDNPRLDHDYTVFGEIVAGRDVAERIQEGDVIATMTLPQGAP